MVSVDFKAKFEEFWSKWNFSNCLLVIDGKHVCTWCPDNIEVVL